VAAVPMIRNGQNLGSEFTTRKFGDVLNVSVMFHLDRQHDWLEMYLGD
jgi:hypothetical protein